MFGLGIYSVFCYNEFLYHQRELKKCDSVKTKIEATVFPDPVEFCKYFHGVSFIEIFLRIKRPAMT